ncbi:MAG TPA: glycosyltransferase family 39 protein [Candidatus Limnocylindrales bacterium]|nr:glycosyltransferase family 39 protein [Candidatus Limnocylindrales bacterium]
MNNKVTKYLLIGIILIASFLRLSLLGDVPISPDWDEVALGYDAYSIMQTGRDEFGNFLPVVLRSFDDYKPALYAYLAIPSVKIFGLNAFATRLPSAIFGILTVLATYFLVKELFKRRDLALLSSFMLAISPWHIQFSRIAFETNVGLAFNIFVALFFIKGLKRPWLLSLSTVCAALSIYVYQSEKVFTPLLMLVLSVIYFKDLLKASRTHLIAALAIGIIAIIPMVVYVTTNSGALLRAQATLAFSDKTTFLKENITRLEYDRETGNSLGKIFDNRRILYIKTGISGYISHFDLNWLFLTGDINRHHAPGMGLLYIWELPVILFGIYSLLFYRKREIYEKKSVILIFAWFLIAPIPAAFTSGVPHAVRTINFLPTYQIFSAFGLLSLITYLKKYKLIIGSIKVRDLMYVAIIAIMMFNSLYYLDKYFIQQNYFYAYDWQYGYEKAIPEVTNIKDQYKRIVVTDKQPLDKSYMFFLYYLKYSPVEFQKIGKLSSGGFGKDHMFDKYQFRLINWDEDKNTRDILFVGVPSEFPKNIKSKKTIYYPDGSPAILIVDPEDN